MEQQQQSEQPLQIWDEATSIGQTFATIGLISGIVLAVIIINIGTRKGYTRLIKKIDELPEDMRTGPISA